MFGDDYPTPDGTCIRDYVHVSDLATAHLLAVDALAGGPVTWNLGNGAGHSVRQVIAAVERVSGLRVPYRIAARRPGDAAVLVASSARAQQAGWRPIHGDLDDIVATAFAWRKSHPRRLWRLSGQPVSPYRPPPASCCGRRCGTAIRSCSPTPGPICPRHPPLRRLDRPVFYSLFMLPLHATLTTWRSS